MYTLQEVSRPWSSKFLWNFDAIYPVGIVVRWLRFPPTVNVKDGEIQMNKYLVKAVFLMIMVFGSAAAYADKTVDTGVVSPCGYLPLVGDNPNGDICVDVPVDLHKNFVVFNNSLNAITQWNGHNVPVAMQHMIQLGGAMKNRIQSGLMQPQHVSIIGVFHGKDAASWLLNDAYWQTQKIPGSTTLYAANPYKGFIEQIFGLKKAGVNIQIEICGVTMHANGWTNDDLYKSGYGKIYVNQGAVGRLIDLEQNGYVYYQPGK